MKPFVLSPQVPPSDQFYHANNLAHPDPTGLNSSLLEETASLTGHLYLNHSNFFVRQQMLQSMRFWLQQGVRGFYLTNLEHLQFNVENPEHVFQLLHEIRALLASPPSSFKGRSPPTHPILLTDSHALDQLAKRMRSTLLDKAYRVQQRQHLGSADQSDLHQMFDLLETWLQLHPQQSDLVRDQVNELFLSGGGDDGSAHHRQRRRRRSGQVLWSVGGHRTVRLATRFSLAHTGLAQFLQAMLPGAINVFYGDELGQKEPMDNQTGQVSHPGPVILPFDRVQSDSCLFSFSIQRLPLAQLSPMAWTAHGSYANFTPYVRPFMDTFDQSTTGNTAGSHLQAGNGTRTPSTLMAIKQPEARPWLPMHPDAHSVLNVQKQQESLIKLRHLLAFRRQHLLTNWTQTDVELGQRSSSPVHQTDDLRFTHQDYLFHYVNQGQLVFERHLRESKGRKRFVLFANFCNCSRQTDFSEKFYFGTIKLATSLKRLRDFLFLNALQLDAGEALIAQVE